ncbi:MAG: helix-turn-helix transcriptional regulator [Alphaproteobacteria bacterium]|jgi:transcriptional regulator|nr:MAG TPA: helix-turn-helix domain protein [Caudoviricetes sp.]
MLGNALRLLRVLHDKKSSDLANELGISPAYLSKIETEKAQPTLEILNKYAAIFQTTTSALLFFSENLDKEKNRGPFKIGMRNIMLKLLEILEGYKDETDKDISNKQ